jgi:ribonuclease Z
MTHALEASSPAGKQLLPLEGFSIAGIETSIVAPSLKVVLDMGRCSSTAVNHATVLVSHGHLDHAGALAQHASRRAMLGMSEATYVVPKAIAEDVERLFNAAGKLDGQAIPRRVVALEPGEEFALPARKRVRPFATFHRVPSQGYTVWETRRKLRDEFRGTPGPELGRLRARGVEIDASHEVALLCFTGDTRVEVLERTPEIRQAETAIIETSFLDDRVAVSDARMMGHIHLDEVVARLELLPRTDVVFSHFSARYGRDEVQGILDQRLPAEMRALVRALG